MPAFVVDTNVWIMANAQNDFSQLKTIEELTRADACLTWLKEFLDSEDKSLAVDQHYIILSQYRNNLPDGSVAAMFLNQLQLTNDATRISYVNIKLDDTGQPVVPDILRESTFDRADYVFVAVSLTHPARPPVVNATDSDWEKDRAVLQRIGVVVEELCPQLYR